MRTLTMLTLLASTTFAQASGPDDATIDQLVALGRLWATVQHVHPDAGAVDWDGALLEALPAARRPVSREELVAILDRLLNRLDDPATRTAGPPTPPRQWSDMTEAVYRDRFGDDTPQPRLEDLGDGVKLVVARDLAQLTTASKRAQGHALRATLEGAADAEAIVLDLRTGALPYADEVLDLAVRQFRGDLRDALPLLLDAPLHLPTVARRIDFGHPPLGGTYSSGGFSRGLYVVEHPVVRPGATRAPRLVVVVDPHNPEATDLATCLRAARRASVVLVGDASEIREMTPVRIVELPRKIRVAIREGRRVFPAGASFEADATLPPTATDADVRAAALELAKGPPPTPLRHAPGGEVQAPLAHVPDTPAWDDLGTDVRLLALFRIWTTFDRYYPYKHLFDEPWDRVLRESIPVFLEARGRPGYVDAVRRILARTTDGHTRLGGTGPVGGPATLPLALAVIEGQFAVLRAPDAELDIAAGDVIVAIDGKPAWERFAELAPLISSSTRHALELRVARQLLAGADGSTARLTLRRAEREWDVSLERALDAWPATRHPIGKADHPVYTPLTPRIGYADLDRLTNAEVDRMFKSFADLPALILDMRGYPSYTMPLLADRLSDASVTAARMRLPVPYGDTHDYSLSFEHRFGSKRPAIYHGKIVVLINAEAISQAEHTCLVIDQAADDVTFVGSPTRGANGDVTTFGLPGGLTVTFTGWDVRHADGRQLQRLGIQPDVPVTPTLQGLREGRDEVLEAAVRFLQED